MKLDCTADEVEEHKVDSHKSSKRKRKCESSKTETGSDQLCTLFDSLCQFLRQSLSFHMQHVYASHVIRAVLQVMSRRPIDDVIVHGRRHGNRQQHRHSDAGLSSFYS